MWLAECFSCHASLKPASEHTTTYTTYTVLWDVHAVHPSTARQFHRPHEQGRCFRGYVLCVIVGCCVFRALWQNIWLVNEPNGLAEVHPHACVRTFAYIENNTLLTNIENNTLLTNISFHLIRFCDYPTRRCRELLLCDSARNGEALLTKCFIINFF